MRKFTFQPNQLVYIKVDLDSEPEVYSSRIEDLGEDTLSLAAPLYKSGVIRLAPGEKIWVEFAAIGSFFRFQTVVRDNQLEPIPLVIVDRPRQIERLNRRRFFRFQTRLPLSFRRGEDFFTGHTIELSGNGFCAFFALKLPKLAEDEELEFFLSLPDGLFEASGRIVRLEQLKEDRIYLYGEFLKLSEAQQDRLVAYLFSEQRKLRQQERE